MQKCMVCGKPGAEETLYPAELVRPALVSLFIKEGIHWDSSGFICMSDLNRVRALYLERLMKTEKGETRLLQKDVKKSLAEHDLLAENVNRAFEKDLSVGDRLADNIASFGGSWKFIISFGLVLFSWIVLNVYFLTKSPFDPYPFILLNLVLSCLAAIQAPVILMSQNRHAAKDRLKMDYEYKINLKAELEVRHLNEKIDFLLVKQWQRLLQIQDLQTDLMEELLYTNKKNRPEKLDKEDIERK